MTLNPQPSTLNPPPALRVLGIVPARGGSKGVPRKNLRLLGSKPLLQHTAEAAVGAGKFDRVILTTDDEEIAEAGRRFGLEVPFLRPRELALDDTPMKAVIHHALTTLRTSAGFEPDVVMLLQPTAPFRTAVHIAEAIEQLTLSAARSLVSVVQVPSHFHPDWQLVLEDSSLVRLHNGKPLAEIVTRRQALAPTFVRNGAIYAFAANAFISENSLYPSPCVAYVMAWEDSVNIDTEEDFREAEHRLATRAGQTS